jgi:hypothetical protein
MQKAVGKSGLPMIDMGDNAKISNVRAVHVSKDRQNSITGNAFGGKMKLSGAMLKKEPSAQTQFTCCAANVSQIACK